MIFFDELGTVGTEVGTWLGRMKGVTTKRLISISSIHVPTVPTVPPPTHYYRPHANVK